MKIRELKENKKGITLVELLIAIALLSIVLAAAFNLFFFNNRLFVRGTSLSQVQFDVRMASQHVTKELRNSSEISTTNSSLTNTIDLSTLTDKYPLIKDVSFEIDKRADSFVVLYTIQGSDANDQNPYQLDTEVLLNNSRSMTNVVAGSGTEIHYSK